MSFDLLKATRAMDSDRFQMRVRAASMAVASEIVRDPTATDADRAFAVQMFNNPGRPTESLGWLIAQDAAVNAAVQVDEHLTVNVDGVTDDQILAAARDVWSTVANSSATPPTGAIPTL